MPRIAAPSSSPEPASATTFINPFLSPAPGHRPLAGETAPAASRRLFPGHAGAAERGIDEQRVGLDAVRDAALVAVEQIRRHDLVVVVGGVGEGAAAAHVAERPDAL